MKYFLFVVICFFFISNVCAYGEDELKNMMDDVNSNDIGYKKKWTAALRTESRRRPVSKKHSYISSGVSDIQETIIPESPPFRVVVDLPPNRPIRE